METPVTRHGVFCLQSMHKMVDPSVSAVYLQFAPCDDLDVHQLAANQLPKTFRIHALKDVKIC